MTDDIRTLEDLQATHKPAPGKRYRIPPSEATEHAAWRNYVRDIILGYNDGLVSVFAAVAGVAGAALATREILISGVAFAVAGALSMGLGEYLSTKSQAEYYRNEAQREREHIRKYRGLEKQEVREMLEEKDYPPHVVDEMVAHIVGDEDRFVDFMMREEFGVGEESERSPWIAMGLVMIAFIIGAFFPVIPFAFDLTPLRGLAIASGLSILGLFAAGAIKGRVSGLSWVRSGSEMLLFGVAAAVITFGIGRLFGIAIA